MKTVSVSWFVLFLVALLIASPGLHAEEVQRGFTSSDLLSAAAEDEHRIDAAMARAQEADPSTAGQTKAIDAALKEWDKLLNQSYQKILKKLDPAAVRALRESQRVWAAWRDKELKNLESFYSRMQGTMYVPMGAYARMNLTRQRAMQLERQAALVDERD